MNKELAGVGQATKGVAVIDDTQVLAGVHTGPVIVRAGGSLTITGTLHGPLRVEAEGTGIVSGTINGAVVAHPGGQILTNEGSVINGASVGTIGFASLNGASGTY